LKDAHRIVHQLRNVIPGAPVRRKAEDGSCTHATLKMVKLDIAALEEAYQRTLQ
jgi:hypothetical protein